MDESHDTFDDTTGDDATGNEATGDRSPSDDHRRRVAWVLAFFAAAIVALAAIQLFWQATNPGTTGAGIGHPLPDLQLEPLTGGNQPVSLEKLAGKVVLLDFWGTWCPPCRAEFPHIAAIGNEYRDRADFQLLAVSCGDEDDEPTKLKSATESFLKNANLNVPTFYDPESFTRQQLNKAAPFEGYPTTLVLDRHGVIRGRWVGYEWGTERQIGSLVAKLLSEPQEEPRTK